MMMQSKVKKTKNPFLRSVRNFFLSIIVLGLIAFVAGACYIWYVGRNDDNRFNNMQSAESIKAPTLQAAKVDENAPVGVALQVVSSPVLPGSEASIAIRTNREATCKITVIYDKTPSKDPNLTEKTANEFGGVDWTWAVDGDAPIGKWPVTVTCSKNGRSGVYAADLEVVRSL